MKRLLSILLAMALVLGCASAVADSDKDMMDYTSEYALEIMKYLVQMYDLDPNSFDADYIYLLHTYLDVYNASKAAKIADMAFSLKGMSSRIFFDDLKRNTEAMSEAIYTNDLEMYYKWVKREIDDKNYAELLISLARVAIESNKD